jgi:hypothetical protein
MLYVLTNNVKTNFVKTAKKGRLHLQTLAYPDSPRCPSFAGFRGVRTAKPASSPTRSAVRSGESTWRGSSPRRPQQ